MKYFYCPDFMKYNFYIYLLNVMKDLHDAFYEDRKIYNIYGCFPAMKWNSGRISYQNENEISEQKIDGIINLYKHFGINLSITATTPLINEELLNDKYCNMIMEKAQEYNQSVLVGNQELESVLRERYKNLKISRSLIQTERKPYDTNGYDVSVLDVNKNNDWEFLFTIPYEERDKIEIIVNENCIENCPNRFNHYRYLSSVNQNKENQNIIKFCPLENGRYTYFYTKKRKHYIDPSMIDEYEKYGFNKFKIVGRYSMFATIHGIVEYLVKPEYRTDILRNLFEWVWKNKEWE